MDASEPMGREDLMRFADVLTGLVKKRSQTLFYRMYPDETTDEAFSEIFQHGKIFARELYTKHMEFFKMGAEYRERCFMAANRVSKTLGGGAYETAVHLTGEYPHWWEGKRFNTPIRAWAAGKSNETTRDAVQKNLLGDVMGSGNTKSLSGTGMILGDRIGKVTWKTGVNDLADTIKVRHKSGGWSSLGLKSYHQGRGSFEATSQHVIWLDEEPPLDVYGECVIRTATTNGIVMLTFTPLEGLSETVMQFMPQEMQLSVN